MSLYTVLVQSASGIAREVRVRARTSEAAAREAVRTFPAAEGWRPVWVL